MFPKYELRSTSVSVLRLSPGREYPVRFHKQVEIGLVEKGSLSLSVAGQELVAEAGDLYLAFPNVPHGIRPSDAEGIVLIADPVLFPAYEKKLNHHVPGSPLVKKSEVGEWIPAVFHRLATLFQCRDQEHCEPIFLGYIAALLGEVLLRRETVDRSSDSDLLQGLMLLLQSRYTREITLESVAKELGYSKWYLSKVIATTFHCNFRSLINSFRISRAQSLLLSQKKSISEVAFDCGFRNQSSFNRIFLENVGMTPSRFREQGGKVEEPQLFYR